MTQLIFSILILASNAHATSCLDVFHQTKVTAKRGELVEVFPLITSQNAEVIFTHNYDAKNENVFGAKAVAYRTEAGSIRLYFMPTGKGRTGWNVHHRDLLAWLVKSDQRFFSKMSEDLVSDAEKAGDTRAYEWATDIWIRTVDELAKYDEVASLMKDRGENRKLSEDPRVVRIMANAQGYQLSAQRIGSRWKILRFDIDSSITKFQRAYDIRLDSKIQDQLLEETLKSIDSSLLEGAEINRKY